MANPGVHTLKYAAINCATIAEHSTVPAVAGKRIVLISYTLLCGGAVSPAWKSGTTALTGPMAGGAKVIRGGRSPESPALQTAVGEALILSLPAAVQVSGHLTYIEAA